MEKLNVSNKKLAVNFINNLKSTEMDLYLTIMYQLTRQNKAELKLSFEKLKDISNFKSHDNERFIGYIERISDTMTSSVYRIEDSKRIEYLSLIPTFGTNEEKEYIILKTTDEALIKIKSDFGYLTKNMIKEFSELKTRYAKLAYLVLKQNNNKNIIKFEVNEFKKLFNISDSYRLCDLDKRVFQPMTRELSSVFEDFSIKKNKAKKGNVIGEIIFLYKPSIAGPILKKYSMKNITKFERIVAPKNINRPKITIKGISKDEELYKIIQDTINNYYEKKATR